MKINSKNKMLLNSKDVYRWPTSKLLIDFIIDNYIEYFEFAGTKCNNDSRHFLTDISRIGNREVFSASLEDNNKSTKEVVTSDGYGRAQYSSIHKLYDNGSTIYFVRFANFSEGSNKKVEMTNYKCGYYVFDGSYDITFPPMSTDFCTDLINLHVISGIKKPSYYFNSACFVSSGNCKKIDISAIDIEKNGRKRDKHFFNNFDFDIEHNGFYFYLDIFTNFSLGNERLPGYDKISKIKEKSNLDEVLVKQKSYL